MEKKYPIGDAETKLTTEQVEARKEAIQWYRNPAAPAPNPDELWDEFSEATDHGTVMTKEGWRKVIDKLKQSRQCTL